MVERENSSTVLRPTLTASRPPCRSLATSLTELAAGVARLGERLAAWVEEAAPLARRLTAALEEIQRVLAPRVQALAETIARPEVQARLRGLVELLVLLDTAASYCVPYDRELARLGLAPLAGEERGHFMLLAMLLQDRWELRLGHRLPLAEVALAAGRLDVTAALVMKRAATRRAISWAERTNRQQAGELIAAAYLELRKRILPSIHRRLSKVPLRDAKRVLRPRLARVVNDAYLVKSVTRALIRRLAREARVRQREGELDEETDQRLAQVRHRLAEGSRELCWDIEQALASFLARPRTSDLDRRMIAEFRLRPDASAREIALKIGESVRTVQHRYRQMIGHVLRQLED